MPTTNDRPSRALLERPSTFNDPDNYPAVSVHQPYAGLIQLAGLGYWGKELEIRSFSTKYRGSLVIGASKKVDRDAYKRVKIQLVASGLVPLDVFEAACGEELCGHAVALFDVQDSRRMTAEDHKLAFTTPMLVEPSENYAWVADKIAALRAFPVTGAQGFFRVLRSAVDAAIELSTTPAQRVSVRAAAKRKARAQLCVCNQPLPKHLAEFMNNDPRASHVCRCGVEYVVTRGKFVEKPVEVHHGA